MARQEHMYYNDLPCWCGRVPTFFGPPNPHIDSQDSDDE